MSEAETTLVRTIGRYHAVTELGRGAMGIVYKGYDPAIGRTVALKTIAFGAGDPQAQELRRRLYIEASAAGALTHPNIVTVYDVVEDGTTTAVAMEFVEGQTLASILAERGALPLEEAFEMFEQICAALDYAGSKGIVHRDIKPANILVGLDKRPKVADFGIARLPTSNATQTGMVLGSPSYMSPEQVRGMPLDRRSDLFSAATLFFEMVTLENPFGGTDAATTMYRIAHEPPAVSNKVGELIGLPVAAVLQRALAKDPTERYPTGAELVAALKAAAGGSKTASVPRARISAQPVVTAAPAWQRFGLAAGVLGLLIAGATGVMYMRGGSSEPAAQNQNSAAAPASPASAPPPASAAVSSAAAGVTGVVPAVAAAAAPVAPVEPPPDPAYLDVQFDGPPYPVVIFAGNQQLGRLEQEGALKVVADGRRVRAVGESVFFTKDFGAAASKPGERRKLVLPGLASAVIGVKGDVYDGVKAFLDGKSLPGPYPAQVPRLAAGSHTLSMSWESGARAGTELKQPFEAKAGGHFLIRADPDNATIAVQQVR